MRVIKHAVNKRQGGGRNTGVKVAKGKYLLFIDQDDYYHQGVLLKIYKHLSVNDLDVLVTDSTLEYKGQVNNLLQLNYRNHTIIDGETFVVVNGKSDSSLEIGHQNETSLCKMNCILRKIQE